MAAVTLSATIDTSVLERAIPEIVAFGRRTMIEQTVTSAAIIALNAQAGTVAVAVGTIDAELDVEVTPVTKTGRPSKAKNPRYKKVSTVQGVAKPLAVLIVMARMDPMSEYSKSTGNRWPLSPGLLPTGPGTAASRQQIIAALVSRMTLSRHSSTHFLQHGWSGPIRLLLSNPNFKGWASRGLRQSKVNKTNTLDPGKLGDATVAIAGDACLVLAENAVGEESNEVLDAQRREALIEHGSGPLQEAIDKEAVLIVVKVGEYMDRGLKQRWEGIL